MRHLPQPRLPHLPSPTSSSSLSLSVTSAIPFPTCTGHFQHSTQCWNSSEIQLAKRKWIEFCLWLLLFCRFFGFCEFAEHFTLICTKCKWVTLKEEQAEQGQATPKRARGMWMRRRCQMPSMKIHLTKARHREKKAKPKSSAIVKVNYLIYLTDHSNSSSGSWQWQRVAWCIKIISN